MTPARRVLRWGAVAAALLALVPGYYAVTLRWVPHVDFDVIGFLWLLQNSPRLMAWLLTVAFLAGAAYCWVRSLRV